MIRKPAMLPRFKINFDGYLKKMFLLHLSLMYVVLDRLDIYL